MAAPLAVAVTVNTGDTVVEEGTVLEKRAPDLTSDYTAASWKDPAWGHPEKDRKMRINEMNLTTRQIIKTTAVKHRLNLTLKKKIQTF